MIDLSSYFFIIQYYIYLFTYLFVCLSVKNCSSLFKKIFVGPSIVYFFLYHIFFCYSNRSRQAVISEPMVFAVDMRMSLFLVSVPLFSSVVKLARMKFLSNRRWHSPPAFSRSFVHSLIHKLCTYFTNWRGSFFLLTGTDLWASYADIHHIYIKGLPSM